MFAGKKLQFVSIVTLFFFTWFCFTADFSFAQSNDEDPLLKAKRLSQEGDYDGAVKIIQDYIEKIKLIKKDKQNLAKAYYSLARTYYKVGEEELCDKNLRMVYETYSNFRTEESDLIFKDRTEKIKKEVEGRLRAKKEEKRAEEVEKKVEVKKEKKPVVKEDIPRKEPVKKVVTKPAKKKKKKKKFPVLALALGVGAVVALVVLLAGKKKKSEPPQQNQPDRFTLIVSKGAGVNGSPNSGAYSYNKDEEIEYKYTLKKDYFDLIVELDGDKVSSKGKIIMDSHHNLSVSTKSTGNIAPNPSFESGTSEPIGWNHTGILPYDPNCIWSEDRSHTGERSVGIGPEHAWWYAEDLLDVFPGGEYEISVWALVTDKPENNRKIFVSLHEYDSDNNASEIFLPIDPIAFNKWEKYSWIVSLLEKTVKVKLILGHHDSKRGESVYFDDVVLKIKR